MRSVLLLVTLLAAPAGAQLYIPPALDTSGLVTPAQMASAMAAAVASKADASTVSSLAATIPTPAATVPSMETVGGAVGATMTFRRGDAIQPRITRATVLTTDASCNFTATWTNVLTATPTISLTWVNTTPAAGAIKCELTADPTTSGAAGRCLREQPSTTLAAVTVVGIAVAVGSQIVSVNQSATSSCSGIKVHVIALPPAA